MNTPKINIVMDRELVKKIDEAARAQFMNRSDFIRQAIVQKLHADAAALKRFPFA